MKSSRIMKIFEQYVRKYDMNNINIKARYFHSLKVMEIVKDLATELGIFTEEEIAVCELIGLFHEIGNFSSTPNYHIDEDNEDSSNKAIDVLFNKGLIREISKDKTYDNVIKIALFAYDKNGFPDNIDEKTKHVCAIIKDAHNLDYLLIILMLIQELVVILIIWYMKILLNLKLLVLELLIMLQILFLWYYQKCTLLITNIPIIY